MCDMLRPVTKAVSEPPVTAAMLSSQLTPYPRDFCMASSSLSTVTFSGFLTFLFWRKVPAAPFPSLQCFSTLDHHLHLLFTFLGFSLLLSVNVLIFFSAGSLRSTDGILLFLLSFQLSDSLFTYLLVLPLGCQLIMDSAGICTQLMFSYSIPSKDLGSHGSYSRAMHCNLMSLESLNSLLSPQMHWSSGSLPVAWVSLVKFIFMLCV